ncbi:hypothetical protein M436DRAFT_60193 [Aureobasidium namibiae CBS 147.97]|uniref:Uncharacterized protein n=1 Tax=Aureobasidium namibiae CBS 147.97 TaxID=1043004 RepID=A0A074X3E9_9PEZI
MTETQSLDSQRSGLAQLRSLCIQIVQTETKILIDLGLLEWFYKTLASYRQPRTPKRLDGGKTFTRKSPATERTSEQASKAVIKSRYYKLALYCQIENIKKGLQLCGKSTLGVSFSTMALREWTKRAGDSELREHTVKSWRKQGEKWKILYDRFTLGILEASHKALNAWYASTSDPGTDYLGVVLNFCPSLRSKCLTLSQRAQTRMKQYSFEKLLNESLLEKHGIEARNRVPVGSEARNLKQLYETRRIGASVEEDS